MKSTQSISLREVDSVELISLMDSSIDVLSTIEKRNIVKVQEWVKERRGEEWLREHFRLPIAEHGFSMLINISLNSDLHTVLFDAGCSPDGVMINTNRMGLDLSRIECIVLSHGHYDHFSGLPSVVRSINKEGLPVIVHEDVFKTRGMAEPDGTIRKFPDSPTSDQVKPAEYIVTKGPYLLADNTILVTGEIPRVTSFEKGLPQSRVLINGKWQPDPWIRDDRAIVISLKRGGLVIISGCAHSGIINTALYAQQITGVSKIHAIVGGFHLAGKDCESRITQTVEQLKQLNPAFLIPSHCTGWRGTYAIAKEMPDAFICSSVGNLYRF